MLSTESRTETAPEDGWSSADTRVGCERIDERVAWPSALVAVLNQIACARAGSASGPGDQDRARSQMYVLLAAMLTGLIMQRRWGLLACSGNGARDGSVHARRSPVTTPSVRWFGRWPACSRHRIVWLRCGEPHR